MKRRHVWWVLVVAMVLVDLVGLAVLRDAWQSRQAERMKKTDVRAASPVPRSAAPVDQWLPLPTLGYLRMVRTRENITLSEH